MTAPLHAPWRVDPDDRPGMAWNNHIVDARGHAVCFMAHSDGKSPEGDAERARLIAAAPDNALLLAAICAGVARWEPFSDASGEVCTGGIRYATRIDEDGCPIVSAGIRAALRRELAARSPA